MTMHTMKNGQKIAIAEMGDDHLRNTIAMIERRAIAGVKVQNGGSSAIWGNWYDEDFLYGDEALRFLNYADYANEMRGRTNERRSNGETI